MKEVTRPVGASIMRVSNYIGWQLTIMNPADYSDTLNQPAMSVDVYGEKAILALRDALTEALEDQS